MGMYTCLAFKAALNEAGKTVAAALKIESIEENPWDNAAQHLPTTPAKFLSQWRRTFIPFGAADQFYDWAREQDFDPQAKYTEGDGQWEVVCALKNYENEIQDFLREVLPQMIAEPCLVQVLYEEWNSPTIIRVHPTGEQDHIQSGAYTEPDCHPWRW